MHQIRRNQADYNSRECRAVRLLLVLGFYLLALLSTTPKTSCAEVLLSRDEALSRAFPKATTFEPRSFIIDDVELKAIEQEAKAPVESQTVTFFEARSLSSTGATNLEGYAVIDTHEVRTHTETLLVALLPSGSVSSVILLAFHEPADYRPSERFLTQFEGASGPARVVVHDSLTAIIGSTLTTNAAAESVRRALATFRILNIGKD